MRSLRSMRSDRRSAPGKIVGARFSGSKTTPASRFSWKLILSSGVRLDFGFLLPVLWVMALS
jgi:hypothetical protein